MGDGRLGEVEQRHELADADLARVLSQHVDELHPHRIAERLRHPGHALGVLALDVGIHNGLAAGRAVGTLLLRCELQIDSHLFTYIY